MLENDERKYVTLKKLCKFLDETSSVANKNIAIAKRAH